MLKKKSFIFPVSYIRKRVVKDLFPKDFIEAFIDDCLNMVAEVIAANVSLV